MAVKKINVVVWAAVLAAFVLVGCGGCDERVNVDDEVDCMQYRGRSYADVMDLEPRCGTTAWDWEQTVVNERGETRADFIEDAQRAAGKKWRELVADVCRETLYGYLDTGNVHGGDLECNPAELDDPETRQWLARSALSEVEQRETILAEAHEAEQFGLPCEALDLASRAGDLERVRLLQQEHSHCVIEPAAPGGK